MKHLITGIFESRDAAEKAINHIHNELKIPNEDISFIYRNTKGEIREVDTSAISTNTPAEGAKTGAAVGGTLGAIAGLAVVAGLIPVIGPVFVAGTLASALGIGLTGAVGTTIAGALTGAAAGGLVGSLASMGVGKENAQRYADRVLAGDILVAVYSTDPANVATLMDKTGAVEINKYAPKI
ncbi:MAG: signal transduction histidine kinase, LytS [Candidatus Taylorbacteria bacterium]|nr:signal transduction histidine kinase, LytS [Candidatus Taylorbacteria bacterium]